MALIIEDGSGLNPAANSYITVADFRIGARVLGYDFDTKLNSELETMLIKGRQQMEARYSAKFLGYRSVPGQPLDWPRTGVADSRYMSMEIQDNVIPEEVVRAQIHTALDLYDPERIAKEKEDRIIRVKVGSGGIEEVRSAQEPKNTPATFTLFSADAFTQLQGFLINKGLEEVKLSAPLIRT